MPPAADRSIIGRIRWPEPREAPLTRSADMPTLDPPAAAVAAFSTDAVVGLSEREAAARLARDGLNELPAQQGRGVARIALEVAREPMFLLLVAAGGLYLAAGKPADALMLLGFVFAVMVITVIQERRSERALEALKDLSSPRALVIRDGRSRRIAGREVVQGDMLIVAEGDRVPADALLRRGTHLSVDESLLTGESVPVRKTPSSAATALARPGGDDLSALYSGTLVTAGQGLCEVACTGVRTELGRIGRALQQVRPEATPLQTETGRMVRVLAIAGLAACATVVVVYPLTRGATPQQWKDGLLAGIAMAMAILPEEFPVVLTVFLALGAWRIARSRVLTRRMPAIEALGAATVLCVDKTGTLTENRMTVSRIVAGDDAIRAAEHPGPWPPSCRVVLETALLASRADPFDPTERALHAAAARLPVTDRVAGPQPLLVREYPLAPDLLAVSQAWQARPGGPLLIASKGAPEAIVALCQLAVDRRDATLRTVAELAGLGLRVLAIARTEVAPHGLPDDHSALRPEFLGLVALEDPVRATVPAAVAECRSAGIRVVMITGDYPATAQSIARQAGFDRPQALLTGAQLARLTPQELAARIDDIQVFARVVPEQKLQIVTALKARGEVVGMTGDGVNDAPALKAAHIGIAMGGRGTDVAREAASLVLLDDDFSSIVAAIRLGRRIYDNIRKAVVFILAVHVPIAGLSMVPVFFAGWPLLLLPVHIVFLELIIDPACSLVFEAERAEPNVMRRPPRDPNARLFSAATVGAAVLQGLTVLGVCLAIFMLARIDHGADAARALAFASLVVSFIVIIFINRSPTRSLVRMLHEPNAAAWWVVGGAGALLGLVMGVPGIRRLFHFAALHPLDLALSLLAGVASLLLFEVLKLSPWWRRRHGDPAG
jgi:P-type Ca2+ transporter type 2C